jgi:hypothetical protein
MQHNANDVFMYLVKLSVEFSEKEAVVEWSSWQLAH